jgi:hypothetical protein
MHPFQIAVEERDATAIEAFLANEVVFASPHTVQPCSGKTNTATSLCAVLQDFDDVRYMRHIADVGGRDHAFVFEARIDDTRVSDCDVAVHCDPEGKIDEVTVRMRPPTSAHARREPGGAKIGKGGACQCASD